MLKEHKNYLELAEKAALTAGKFLVDLKKSEIEILNNYGRDIKLKADFESEGKIVKILKSGSDFQILTEERGKLNNNSGEDNNYKWIVDPLDGSFNYSRNIPQCCVSVALFRDDKPFMGVVYDFNRGELFKGVVGEGAWLNNKTIRTNKITDIAKSVLATGFPVSLNFSEDSLHGYISNFKNFKKIRMMGSAALSLSYVSCGRFDIYSENKIKIWDVAAGLALVSAAGGKIAFDGFPSTTIINVTAACSAKLDDNN